MRATIAIPAHNSTKYCEEAFAGAMRQNFEDYEVVVADSSDHDSVQEKVEPYLTDGKARYLRLPPETEFLVKLNILLKSAQGEWMTYLCDDDTLREDYLSVMMKHAESQPQATLIRCRFEIIDGEGHLLRMDPGSKEVMGPAEFLSRLFLPEKKFFKMNISGVLFHRKTFLEEGGFREFPLAWHADLLSWALIGSRGLCIFEKKCLTEIRVHPDSQNSVYDEDLLKAVQTNSGVSDALEHILKRLEQEVTTFKDRKFLEAAKKNVKHYMRRHLSRAFDHGFMAALSTDRPGIGEYVGSWLEKMKQMGVPRFKSALVYSCLGHLAYPVRRPVLDVFKRYKTRKWCR